jgi:hypothetical protein
VPTENGLGFAETVEGVDIQPFADQAVGPHHVAGGLAVREPHTGVATRFEFPGEDCECDRRIDEPHEEGCPADDESYPEGCEANDVFIVEGDQERYGNKAAWEVCRRF